MSKMRITTFRNMLIPLVQKRCRQLQPPGSSLSPSLSLPITTSTSPSPSSSFTVQFLMRSCGFPSEAAAISTSRNLRLDERYSLKYESVVNFLKSHRFSDAQIVKLVTKRPAILRSRVNSIRPKFEYLIDNGFVGSLLAEVVVNAPQIWNCGLSSQIKPSLDMLKRCLETDEDVILAVRRSSRFLTSNLKQTQRNIDSLIRERVPIAAISKLIVSDPSVILHNSVRVGNVLNFIKELGLGPDAPMFVYVFRVRISMSDSTLARKVELLKSLGWSDEDVTFAMKHYPHFLTCSVDRIKGAVDFFVNTVKLEPEQIVRRPFILTYSLEKRCRPRYRLLKFLEARGIIQLSNRILYALLQPEKKFLEKYVNAYLDQVPNLTELYGGIGAARD